MQVPPPTVSVNPLASALHDYAERARDALAIWGGFSLVFIGVGKALAWRNRRKERREHRLRQNIYRYLLNSNESHSAGGVWAEVIIKPLLEGIKLKYALQYEGFPGWKIQLGIMYWNVCVWFRKLGMPSESDVATVLAEMHRNGEVQINRSGDYRIVGHPGAGN